MKTIKLKDLIVLGFISEITLFLISGFFFGQGRILISISLLLIGIIYALATGELIRRESINNLEKFKKLKGGYKENVKKKKQF